MTSTPEAPRQPTPPSAATNTAGLVSLFAGVATILSGAVLYLVQTNLSLNSGYEALTSLQLISNVVLVTLSLIGLGFGIAGAVQRHKPQLAAGIGLGISVLALVQVVGSTVVFAAAAMFL